MKIVRFGMIFGIFILVICYIFSADNTSDTVSASGFGKKVPKDYSIRSIFPNCKNEATDECTEGNDVRLYAAVANNTVLDTKRSTFRVFIDGETQPIKESVQIVILDACEYLKRDNNNTKIEATINSLPSDSNPLGAGEEFQNQVNRTLDKDGNLKNNKECKDVEGHNSLVFDVNTRLFAKEKRYGDLLSIVVKVEHVGGSNGTKHFRVMAKGGKVTMSDLGSASSKKNPTSKSLTEGKEPISFTVRNIKYAQTPQGEKEPETRIRFTFKPDCSYKNNDEVWLKWFDADWGGDAEAYTKNINFILTARPGGNVDLKPEGREKVKSVNGDTDPIPPGGNIGGDLDPRNIEVFGGLDKDTTYIWQWRDIQQMNGLQLWMPFSEIGPFLDCGTGTHENVDCRLIDFKNSEDTTFKDNSGNDRNVDDWHYAIWVNDWGTSGVPASNINDGEIYDKSVIENDTSADRIGGGSGAKGEQIKYDLIENNKIVSGENVGKLLITTVVKYTQFQNSNGADKIYIFKKTTNNTSNCFQATCRLIIDPTVPDAGYGSNMVKSTDSTVSAYIQLTNTGVNRLRSPLETINANYSLAATLVGTGEFDHSLFSLTALAFYPGLDPGQSSEFIPVSLKNPGRIGSFPVIFYPDYWGRSRVGQPCTERVNVYQEFNIVPYAIAELKPDEEDPNIFEHEHGWYKKDGIGPSVNVTGAKHIWEKGAHTEILPQPSSSSDYTKVDSKPVSNVSAGDQYCAQTWINRAHGWRGPGGDNDVVGATDASSPQQCDTVSNKPYLRVYGNDVSAGGGFGEQAGGAGGIKTNFSATKNGSGVQFAAFALDAINNFSSGTLISGASLPSKVDTFANNFGEASGSLGKLGGSFGSNMKATDFYDITMIDSGDEVETRTSRNISVNSLSKLQTHANGDVDLGGGDIAGRKGLYVDGDVYIKGDIKYPDDISGLPYFALIVKGNIYIDPSVTRLDGLYVAQPKDDNSAGQIITCANSSGPLKNYDNPGCRSKLTINGAFVAKSVRFLRTLDSLRDSSRTDDAITREHAAEIFNFIPEMYLGTPPFKNEGVGAGSGSTGRYDSIMTLPPIL